MTNDPIVEEIHRHREEHAARLGDDLHAICEDFRHSQGAEGRPVVTRPPRRPAFNAASPAVSRQGLETERLAAAVG